MSRLLRKQRTSLIPGKFTYNTENRGTINSGQSRITCNIWTRDTKQRQRKQHNTRRVWRYQREVIRIRISKKNRQHNGQKKKYKRDKQQSTKYTHTTKDRVTRTPLKTGSELMCSGRVGSLCSTSGTRGVSLVIDPVISHVWGKNQELFPRVEHIRCHLWNYI
jgi:hypothetical protein